MKKETIWTRGFSCVLIANTLTGLAQFSVNTYITSYMKYLGMGEVLIGFIAGVYYFVALALRPVSGPAITVLNKRKLMIAVYSLGAAVNLGYALFPSTAIFVCVRLIHGIQLAFYGSLAMTIAAMSLPESKMASGIGIYGLSGIVSQALGPSMAIFVRNLGEARTGEGGGFQALFLTSAIIAAASVVPCVLLEKDAGGRAGQASHGPWYKNIVAFETVLPSLVVMLMSMCGILFSTYLIRYGEYKGINGIGLFFTANAVAMVCSRPFLGKLTDRYGVAKVFYPGMAVYIAAFLLIASARSLPQAVAAAVCASVGGGAVTPSVQAMIMQSVEPERRAVASNTNFIGMDLGNFLGPTLAGIVLSVFGFGYLYYFALIPLAVAVVVFTLSYKPYLAYRAALAGKETGAGAEEGQEA